MKIKKRTPEQAMDDLLEFLYWKLKIVIAKKNNIILVIDLIEAPIEQEEQEIKNLFKSTVDEIMNHAKYLGVKKEAETLVLPLIQSYGIAI